MDAEPKSLRPFVLVATAFVMFGGVAGFMVWWLERERGASPAPTAPTGASDAPRPVGFAADVAQAERDRLTADVAAVVTAREPGAAAREEADLVASGEHAFPPLLDALYRASTGAGFSDPARRARARAATRVLAAIRERLEPGTAGPEAVEADAPSSVETATSAWFSWWSRRASGTPGPIAPERPGPK